jgi:hypothetical protein
MRLRWQTPLDVRFHPDLRVDDFAFSRLGARPFREVASATGSWKHHEWLDYPSEGHGWYIDADSIDFWTHVERFLQANLAPQP